MKTMTRTGDTPGRPHGLQDWSRWNLKTRTWLEEKLADAEERLGFEQERIVLLATDEIYRAMKTRGITKAELAKRIGKSKAYVTQVLSGTRNMTLRTFGEFAWACDHTVNIDLSPAEGCRFILHWWLSRSRAEGVRFVSPESWWRSRSLTPGRIATIIEETQPEGLAVAV